jgi:hypothetical protein
MDRIMDGEESDRADASGVDAVVIEALEIAIRDVAPGKADEIEFRRRDGGRERLDELEKLVGWEIHDVLKVGECFEIGSGGAGSAPDWWIRSGPDHAD